VSGHSLENSVVLRNSRSSDLSRLTLNGTLVLGPNFTLLRKVKRRLPARSSTPTVARRLRASAYCESGDLCLKSHPLVPVSSARDPLCTTDDMDYTSIGECNPLLLWEYCLDLSVDELATQNALRR
jgi:hypothetical protein